MNTPPELPHDTPQAHQEAALPARLDFKHLVEGLLRRPHELMDRLATPGHGAGGKFTLIMLVSCLVFGVVLGCFAKHEQLWAAPLKIAAGMLISGAICFPSLYIFATLAGARASLSQLSACLAGSLAIAGLLLLGCSPAVWIFAESTDSFGFMGFLAIGAWVISLFFALKFLLTAIRQTGGSQSGPLFIWGAIFALVTLQMTTSLRPILGRSDVLLTQEKKFFLQHWGEMIGESLTQVPAGGGAAR